MPIHKMKPASCGFRSWISIPLSGSPIQNTENGLGISTDKANHCLHLKEANGKVVSMCRVPYLKSTAHWSNSKSKKWFISFINSEPGREFGLVFYVLLSSTNFSMWRSTFVPRDNKSLEGATAWSCCSPCASTYSWYNPLNLTCAISQLPWGFVLH